MLSHKLNRAVIGLALITIFAAGCAPLAAALSQPVNNAPAAPQPVAALTATPTAGASVTNSAGSGGQSITVSGTGTATGAPDMAQFSVGVQTQGSTVQQAVTENQTLMTALLAALKAQGILDKDIQTSNFSVSVNLPEKPVSAPSTQATATPATYQVNNQVTVTVHDITKLATVLDKAIAAGANNVYGVTFGITDPTKLQDTARANAVKDAKARADSLAKLEGLTLGNVLTVSEGSVSAGPFPASAFGIGGGGTPIQTGEQTVTVSIQVTYSIK